MDSPVTHDLFYQSNGISGVGLVKEDNCVQVLRPVLLGSLLGCSQELCYVLLSSTTMHLLAIRFAHVELWERKYNK